MSTAVQRTPTDHQVQYLQLFSCLFFSPSDFLPVSFLCVISGMTGNYLLTNPLLRTHDTNPYNNLLAETVVCNTPSPPAFHSPGAHPPSTFVLTITRVWFWEIRLCAFWRRWKRWDAKIVTTLIPVWKTEWETTSFALCGDASTSRSESY